LTSLKGICIRGKARGKEKPRENLKTDKEKNIDDCSEK